MVKNVEILCKNLSINPRINFVKLCEKLLSSFFVCKIGAFPQTFSSLYTTFFTTNSSLFISRLFHFSTEPITTTINNLLERN